MGLLAPAFIAASTARQIVNRRPASASSQENSTSSVMMRALNHVYRVRWLSISVLRSLVAIMRGEVAMSKYGCETRRRYAPPGRDVDTAHNAPGANAAVLWCGRWFGRIQNHRRRDREAHFHDINTHMRSRAGQSAASLFALRLACNACSPSRKVVSKIMTCWLMMWSPMLGAPCVRHKNRATARGLLSS